jgi:hypothetical protein
VIPRVGERGVRLIFPAVRLPVSPVEGLEVHLLLQ